MSMNTVPERLAALRAATEKYDDFEEYLMTLEDGYGFRLLDCSWMAVERLQETVYGF